jgi:hypothetical protein
MVKAVEWRSVDAINRRACKLHHQLEVLQRLVQVDPGAADQPRSG